MSKQSFKEYLKEYYEYVNSFSDVVDKEDDELTKIDSPTRNGRRAQKQKRAEQEVTKGDGKEEYNPTKFLNYMEISNVGD